MKGNGQWIMDNGQRKTRRIRAAHFLLALSIIHCQFSIAFAADEKWLLTTAQFKTESVLLKSLDASGVKVATADGGPERTVPMEEFLDLTRRVGLSQGSGKFLLHMSGGDHLGGEPVSLGAESMTWKSAELGEISIPTRRIIAITQPGASAPSDRQHEDVVRLSNGDTVHGIIASITADTITVQTSAGESEVPFSAVTSVSFAVTPAGGDTDRAFRVRLDDGSSLVESAVRLDAGDLVLVLGKKGDHKVPLDHLTAIEQVNGPVSWLSARTPSAASYYRFIGGSQEPAAYMDRSWGGERGLEFKGRAIVHGIAVHALSRLSWALDGKYQAFRTRYAIEGDGGVADVTVTIKLDDRVVYQKAHARCDWLSPVIVEDLSGAKKLTLEVDGGTAYSQDSLDWIEPALLRNKPTEAPADSVPAEPVTQPGLLQRSRILLDNYR